MPLLKKKVYDLAPYPGDLKPSEELFVIPETRECFRSYEYPLPLNAVVLMTYI